MSVKPKIKTNDTDGHLVYKMGRAHTTDLAYHESLTPVANALYSEIQYAGCLVDEDAARVDALMNRVKIMQRGCFSEGRRTAIIGR